MDDRELRERLEKIEKIANDKGHFFIILALIVLLTRGCT